MTGALALLFAFAEVDSAHGRIEGDLGVAVAAGITAGPRAPRATGDLRLRYLSTAGVFGTYEEGFASSEPRRAIATGVELRPLFLARWVTGHELGSPRADLFIDSLALELGAAFVQPDGARFRPALQAGLGLELPFFDRAEGLFAGLHVGARWSDAALAGNAGGGPSDRALFASLTLGWQELFAGPIAR
ncbi:MAG: hypothetical protein KIT84_44050 [Labilithrix sp.]|nr:hypothetical protein [Labilithrix sp.]MCW5818052.1 hypothetical protein [Labilithrix sp.]